MTVLNVVVLMMVGAAVGAGMAWTVMLGGPIVLGAWLGAIGMVYLLSTTFK